MITRATAKESFMKIRVLLALAMLCLSFGMAHSLDIARMQEEIARAGLRFTVGENWVTRLSAEERGRLGGALEPIEKSTEPTWTPARVRDLPSSFDWRSYGPGGMSYVSSVKNQGSCGSCWAFSMVGLLESMKMIACNLSGDPDYSEQAVLSCSGAGGCGGGSPEAAITYIRDYGVPPWVPGEVMEAVKPVPDPGCDEAEARACYRRTRVAMWEFLSAIDAQIDNELGN